MLTISSLCLAALLLTSAVPAFAFTSNAPTAFHDGTATQLVSMHSRTRSRRHHCNGTHNGNCRLYRKNF